MLTVNLNLPLVAAVRTNEGFVWTTLMAENSSNVKLQINKGAIIFRGGLHQLLMHILTRAILRQHDQKLYNNIL